MAGPLEVARARLAALRARVADAVERIRANDVPDPVELEWLLIGLRDDEAELVAEIARLESAGGDEDGSAGALVPRRPRPMPLAGAAAAPIPPAPIVLVSALSEP